MKEHPILFSGPMVRAILDGRKTQTRRIVQYDVTGPNYPNTYDFRVKGADARGWRGAIDATTRKGNALELCPYGQPGDRLWVRETWMRRGDGGAIYKADYEGPEFVRACWLPSIHMPRVMSRITLELTDVRVERLQEISEADCVAEGTPCYVCGRHMDGLSEDDCHCFHKRAGRHDFETLWDSINAKRAAPWSSSPWVWALTFRRLP